ncbi:MAG: exosortase system-associated protein, TIGR04073 family [Candidatus Omnitrophica bacterium]|nr:exosortase system-associated protein, TIGR04073 family [Candidatus Omnitrophota bacterium]
MKKVLVLGMLFCFVFSMTAQAKDIWQMAESPKYGEKAGGMLGRGLLNAVTCFVDIPVQTVKGTQEAKPEFIGAVGGFAKGAVCTVLRAASGVIDVATFWVPGFNGLPVSRKYENCLDFGAQPAAAVPTGYVAPDTGVYPAAPAAVPAESRLKYVKK